MVNVIPIFKKGWKDDPGSYRPISLTSLSGKVMERIILGTIMDQLKVNQGIKPSQHGFMNGRSCLTNLISFYDKVTRLVDKDKTVNVVHLVFIKAFDTVHHCPHREAGCLWSGWAYALLGETLAGWLGLKGCGQWN